MGGQRYVSGCSRRSLLWAFSWLTVAGWLITLPEVVQAVESERTSTPNVVVIFMDDMGYADIGPFGAKAYPTPHLDQMAEEGRIFTDFYVTQAVCSASRAGLLTGCYNVRVGIGGALGPKSKIGIHEDEVTLGDLAKQKNYATACYGKWHLGHHRQFLPMQNGFDDYFGLPYSNDMWPYHPGVRHLPMEKRIERWPHLPLIDGNDIINPRVDGEAQKLLTTQYTEHAVEFINEHKDEPFLAYLSFYSVHTPLMGRPDLVEKYKQRAAKIEGEEFGPEEQIFGNKPRRVRLIQKHAVYAAMVEATMLATEAKAAALQNANILSSVSQQIATGTGTDAIAVVSGSGPQEIAFCGKHVLLGETIGRLVISAVESSIHF